jgi:hypothetical protein
MLNLLSNTPVQHRRRSGGRITPAPWTATDKRFKRSGTRSGAQPDVRRDGRPGHSRRPPLQATERTGSNLRPSSWLLRRPRG